MNRILQIVTDTDRRGAQVFAIDLHDALARLGEDVRTVALAPGDVGGLDVPVLGQARKHPATLRALRREMRGATIALAHGSTTLPACAITATGLSTPFVYRQISDSRFWAPSRARRLRVRIALHRAAHVVALWAGAAETLSSSFGVSPSKISIIPNGVKIERFQAADSATRANCRLELGLDPERTTLVVIGALAVEKGVDVTIDALAALPEVQLLVVGDGEERRSLEARARAVAPGRVTFRGSVDDPIPAYAAADIVVLASRGGDSMPAVPIEAGLMELPVVATPVGAMSEIIADGETGLLIPCDSTEAVIEAVRKLQFDPDRARQLGRAARARCCSRFGIDAVAARWLDVVEQTLRASTG